jgi:beta-glucuronidase
MKKLTQSVPVACVTNVPGTVLAAVVLFVAVVVIGATPAEAATRVTLDGDWQFKTDPAREGEARGWWREPPGAVETVRVPHTWNVGRHEDFEGTAWYFKTFEAPDGLRGRRVELNFGATFYKARVWMNGVELGAHEGGHTAYRFDVTPHLKRVNAVAVQIDNRPTESTIPGWAMRLRFTNNIWYDWWHYGGIVRSVWLTVNDAALVRRQQIRARVDGRAAEVADRVFLENTSARPVAVKLLLRVVSPDGGPAVASAERALTLSPGASDHAVSLRVPEAQLWNVDDPKLYRLDVELRDAKGATLDTHSDTFGIRTIEIRDRRLYVNGDRVRLTGMTRHEESPWEGLAESAGTIRRDYDEMKALQVTLTRPVHYPQHPDVLDYCDRNGILLIPEIPVWQFDEKQMSDPKVLALARQMLREMVEEAGNHPSIFAWSVCNESETFTAGGRAYFKTLRDMLKEIDPDRFVTCADDSLPRVERAEDSASNMADFIMMNEYFGTWAGPADPFPEVLDRIGKMFPDKMLIISEFGAAGMFAPDLDSADLLRSKIMRDQLALFSKYDWIGGAIFWCYQDYKSHRNLRPGMDTGQVEMGLVDENRQRRPSFDLWRELNSPVKVALDWNPQTVYTAPAGFRAVVSRRGEGELPSHPLRGYRLVWEARDDDDVLVARGEQVLPDVVGEARTVEGKWTAPASKAVTLKIGLYRPTGFPAYETKLRWWQPRSDGEDVDEMKKKGTPVPQ